MKPPALGLLPARARLRLAIRGGVQGVGFRPFVHRLAAEERLAGWISNSSEGILLEVEGEPRALTAFRSRLTAELPPRAFIGSLEAAQLDPAGYTAFEIRPSSDAGVPTAVILPDGATCRDCVDEIFDPGNRRHRYPFTNCTRCGPRYTILERLPYDRPHTSMKRFSMCEPCRREYEDPRDRRFHAQPIACDTCGPRLALWDRRGASLASRDEALRAAAAAIHDGGVVAVKGLGGFQLVCDAFHEEAVARLRRAKGREEKPFAVMALTTEGIALPSATERSLLESPEAPIVLMRRPRHDPLAPSVAPGNPYVGLMLPTTPLHHLLLAELRGPMVATSGNRAGEPLYIDEHEALDRLEGIADLFLVHDRPIVRPVDDSVVRVVLGRQLVLRRARGYAPLPRSISEDLPAVLATGSHQKVTIALAHGREVTLSQHLGDLETEPAWRVYRSTVESLIRLTGHEPRSVACDAHPDYRSSRFAQESSLPVLRVQHHHAHILSCMAENELEGPVLGVAWDGAGWGTDGTIWGGEFLRVEADGFSRPAHLRTFPLPGGDRAAREPRRSALGLLHELRGEESLARADGVFAAAELRLLRGMLARGVASPRTSSAGRLFDAVASLVGLRHRCSFEGQAAMELEFAADGVPARGRFALELDGDVLDWGPLIEGILASVDHLEIEEIAAELHQALVEGIVSVARRVGEEKVVLTGGCFQNRILLEGVVRRLRQEGFLPCWHQHVPPNDGGIALGQVVAAARAGRR